MSQLERFRQEIDAFMKSHPQSPLDHNVRDDFVGLAYFDKNSELILEVEVDRFDDDEPLVTMQTSTGATQDYRRWGRFKFEIDGETASLVIYSDPSGREFFMPFKDATNGTETYGAGRYMDSHRPGMEMQARDRFEIDFNYAYNPYCAYSPYFSCPLPPSENWLNVPIRAGEKDFRSSSKP
jgi:uncharacterized protein (DUF1684 family)